jgi:signal transduction histidine kinase
MTLKRVLSVAFSALAVTLAATSMALIVATTRLHRTVQALTDGIESIRLASESEMALISHDRAVSGPGRAIAEADLRQSLVEAQSHVSSDRERQLLDEASRRVEAYLTHPEQGLSRSELFETALERVRELARLSLQMSKAERNDAERWDRWANALGTSTVAVSLLGLVVVLFWLRRTTFRPALDIADVVRRQAQGDQGARAREEGAIELRSIAHHVNDMADALAQRDRDRLAFLAGVAHDLRNPLGALKLASGAISPDQPLPPEDRIRQTLARVQRQINRLDRMVWDFLDASRVEAGILDMQPERCDLREIAEAVTELFRPAARSHELVLSLPEEPAFSHCDPGRIEQVLTNLVSNAIKYSPKGGRVEVRVSRPAGRVRVSVSDEGVGIAEDDLTQVFEPFKRRGTSKECIPGVGLGLFVSRRIVEAHGGSIEVESAPHRGSTFHVVLPSHEREAIPPPAPRPAAGPPRALH